MDQTIVVPFNDTFSIWHFEISYIYSS